MCQFWQEQAPAAGVVLHPIVDEKLQDGIYRVMILTMVGSLLVKHGFNDAICPESALDEPVADRDICVLLDNTLFGDFNKLGAP